MKRALLVIEVQNEHVSGTEVVTYPSLLVSMPNIAMAMDIAASNELVTVEVVRVADADAASFAKGSEGAALHALIADNHCDMRIESPLSGSFHTNQLASWLKEQNVTTVTVVGYTADDAVCGTVERASAAGFEVEVLVDATGSRVSPDGSESDRAVFGRAVEALKGPEGVTISTTSAWDDAITSGKPLAASRIRDQSEDERPSRLRSEFYKIESWARAEADTIDADAEAYQIQHTFVTGAQPL